MSSPAFIWDLDGTLFDSYAIIVSAVCQGLGELGITVDKQEVFRKVTATSVSHYLQEIADQYGYDQPSLFSRCSSIQTSMDDNIHLNPNAAQVLQVLHDKGAQHFVYTHKGGSAQSVLDRLGIGHYFTEVVTAAQGFTRKPAPDGVDYLADKYNLDKSRCYYVGDRTIDMACAANAKIQGILYLYSPSSAQGKDLATYCVEDLQQILELSL